MLPAALLAGRGIHLIHGGPEPHGTVPDGQLGCIHSPAFEVEKNLAPALRDSRTPSSMAREPFLATRPLRQQLQGRRACHSRPEGRCGRRQPRYRRLAPHPTYRSLQPSYSLAQSRLRRETVFAESPRRIRAQKNLEGCAHFTAGNPFEIEPWQGRFQRLGSAHIGRHQG